MTIKEFACLCGCNAQTLRYYDRIGLLKPAMVAPWSGYRHYSESQAVAFIKIKNLQAADFSIDEIKALLTMPDRQVYEAFEQKIAAQTKKLERIKEIQQLYLTEKNNMERLVKSVTDYLMNAVSDFEMLREFGLLPTDGPAVVEALKGYIARTTRQDLSEAHEVYLNLNGQVIRGADRVADAFEALQESGYEDTVLLGDETMQQSEELTTENSETVWECHGWKYVYEFLDRVPQMESGYRYCFSFRLNQEKYREKLEFPMFMIATMLPRTEADKITLGCKVERSSDNENHVALLRGN